MRIPKLDKEAKIYLLIALIIFLWISFLPEISAFVDKVWPW
ncbi:MAG: hypothetical protein PHW32_01235 [Bacilli bacterium]|nr:hypothetical protein [Bacilli bacterium]MDD4282834.1 hypothetical protein [Bacilli bacterium]MDD4719212.1 hypothetical protein [Bacilli bacterium]